jgi:hypothetical protein
VRDPDRPEQHLPERPRAVGGTLTDVRAPPSMPVETTRVTGPLLTADESDEGEDDEPLFSDEQKAPRFADVEDDDEDDDEGFLDGSTVAETGALPRAEAPTRITVTPRSDGAPAERTVVAPVDFAALNAPSTPTALAADGDGDDVSSDFDAPTMVGGALPDVAEEPPPPAAADATFVGVPPTAADAVAAAVGSAADTPRAIVPEMTTSTTAPAPATTLSPIAYMGIGFAAASVLGLLIAAAWSWLG